MLLGFYLWPRFTILSQSCQTQARNILRPLEVLPAFEQVGRHVVFALDEDLAALLELVPLAQGVHAPLAHLNENGGQLQYRICQVFS